MAVRTLSVVLAGGLAPGVQHVLYTVPADRTLIVKEITLVHFASGPREAQVAVQGGSHYVQVIRDPAAAPGVVQRAIGLFTVLEPGMSLYGFVAGSDGDLRVTVSGALLAGVAT